MRFSRSRLVGLLMALLCVAAAAAAVRATNAEPEYDAQRGRVGQPVSLEGGAVTVERVAVGTQLTDAGTVTDTTPGLFVVVTVTAAATGTEPLTLSQSRLLAAGDHEYGAYDTLSSLRVEPGFAEQLDYVYEVDPGAITDLTMELWQNEIVHGFQQHVQVHLGITADNAGAWRAAGAGQVLQPDTDGSRRGLP